MQRQRFVTLVAFLVLALLAALLHAASLPSAAQQPPVANPLRATPNPNATIEVCREIGFRPTIRQTTSPYGGMQ